MKINILHDYFDPTKGGIENSAYYLLKELSKYSSVRGVSKCVSDNYLLDDVDYIDEKDRLFKFKRLIWLFKKSYNIEPVFNIAMNRYSAVACYIVNKLKGTKYIVLAHGNEVYFSMGKGNSLPDKLNYCKRKFVSRLVFENAEYVCCNSKYTKKLVDSISKNITSVIIHPGINYCVPAHEYKLEKHMILSIGRLVERKGFQFVIKSMKKLVKRYPDIECYIAGDGPYKPVLEDLAEEYGVANRVHFLGRISEKEKNSYLSRCSLLVMPSIEIEQESSVEGFGIVYVEANMHGKYVLATNTGGVLDAIPATQFGYLLNDTSIDSVEKGIAYVYDNFEDIYLEENVKKRIEWARKHSFEYIAKEYFKLLKSGENK